ncbi:MAG TPA: bifunctional class I SAM-dependent methyltransferase/glycosyltransferase family 2 protein [Xanthobacteraceae bacterium]|jgi:SAM-dependent methyltransferase|nr:bifunctional class I SAM-dependent methyltransferase/glycosyltransferase family 2 protein [Xanthobacteraceae bacterium]
MLSPLASAETRAVADAMAAGQFGPSALKRRADEVRQHYDRVAASRGEYIADNAYYYEQVYRLLRFIVPPGKRVLQVGCLTPDFLNAVAPSHGVGIDFSPQQIEAARARFPHLHFRLHDDYEIGDDETFDYVLVTDVNDQVDPIAALQALRPAMHEDTRVIVDNYNHLWEPIIRFAERFGLKYPRPLQNWLSTGDLGNILRLCDYEPLQVHRTVLMPKNIPLLAWFCNSFLARLPGLQRLNITNLTVARPLPPRPPARDYSVSIVIPCRNEVGNVAAAVERIPSLGSHTEIIFCDDKSTDGTADEIRRVQALHPGRDIKLYDGPGICKALNVRTGFDRAEGDILMILDADLTTMPEELHYFYDAIAGGKAEVVNGSRFIFPMEGVAMAPLNAVGNRFFSGLVSVLLGQRVSDTLCGTKVLWRRHWPAIRALVGTWGTDDRWGDYDLLFGAAKLHLRIVDLPVHYQERVSGVTKMTGLFRNGLIMLRMCWAAFVKFKLY